jgi:hypothetical protein
LIDPPKYEAARRADFDLELRKRAKVWLPEWQPRTEGADLAGAVFGITARLAGEVAQRLNRIPEKNFRGLLHWLGIRGEAGRAARVPVVFQMTAGADAVLADRGVQVQAAGLEEPVVFETTEPMTVTPSVVTSLYAGDPGVDAYFAAPPGLLGIDVPPDQQNRWRVLSDAPASSRKLQLNPPGGLVKGMVLETEEPKPRQFTVLAVTDGICDIDPAIGDERDAETGGFRRSGPVLPAPTMLKRVTAFAPFAGTARDAQQHAVYIGAKKAFDVESEAMIELRGWEHLDTGYQWAFWGTVKGADKPDWVDIGWYTRAKSHRKVLRKPEGKVDEVEVNKIKNRWLRGLRKSLLGEREPQTLVPLKLFINCDPDEPSPPVKIEGVANASPLVLNTGFYPLGREPRLFDAFYLGSSEAFSKPRANARVEITLGDSWDSPPAVAADSAAHRHVLFAIGTDQALRVVEIKEVGNASNVAFHPSVQPNDGNGRPLKLRAKSRPGVCRQGGISYASAFAGTEVWLRKSPDAGFPEGTWRSLGKPAEVTLSQNGENDVLETVLTRNGADSALTVYALLQRKLYKKESTDDGPWQLQEVKVQNVDIELVKVVPLADLDTDAGTARDQDGLLGVDVDGRLYCRDGGNTWTDVTPVAKPVDTSIYPVFLELPGSAQRRVFAALKSATPPGSFHRLMHFDPADPDNTWTLSEEVVLVGAGLDAIARAPNAVAVFTVKNGEVLCPAQWEAKGAEPAVVLTDLPVGVGTLNQPPARAGARLLYPATLGTLWVIAFDSTLHAELNNAVVKSAALLQASANLLAAEKYRVDLTTSEVADKVVVDVIGEFALEGSGSAVMLDDAGHTTRDQIPITIYRDRDPNLFPGPIDAQGALEIDALDSHTGAGATVFLTWTDSGVKHTRLVGVLSRIANKARLASALPGSVNAVDYVSVEKIQDVTAALRPALDVDKKFGVRTAVFTFPDLSPKHQHVMANTPDLANRRWVVLAEAWTQQPSAAETLIIDASALGSIEAVPARASNPTLSWEYWDGSSWGQIPGVRDETDSLVKSGQVKFCVPANVAETEAAGRKNFWIRARLVGGDYGQESVKLETDTSGKVQTVTRSTEKIRAPFINDLKVTYSLCCPVTPDNVLAEDGGDFVNHSAANAEPDAKIKAFVPLSAAGDERAVYVGFDAPPGAQSMNLLFVLDESPHVDAYPLRAEMHRAKDFEPIDCQDGTRGLSQAGIVKLQFEAPPLKVGLFGRSQHWVRLLPRTGFEADKWQPVIRGVYANAAMAEAHETQRNELLGSSDGRPGLRVMLARTPVVEQSLVLRVRERLSDEDVEELRRTNEEKVVDELAEREGRWVLWEERSDLLSSKPGERVYAFEDDTGDITFGDGLNGMIPPVGRDCIVAESYQRGGGEVANQVTRRTPASLITPLQGVERVAFAGDAAGGSKPDDAARTLQFAPDRLSRRTRLLTLADLERAALEFSVDVAQAFARRNAGGVELFMVMRGSEPLPSAELRRSLTSFLAERASPDLAANGAINVLRAKILTINIKVNVRVADLANADQVREDCEKRIKALLDPKDGGFDGQGWRLGAVPNETDIAARIEDVKHISELVSIDIEAGRASASHLVRLADDGLHIDISPVQGAAA